MMQEESKSALYEKVKSLYEQSKHIWDDVVFEIELRPINPLAGDKTEHYFIDYSDCVEDFPFYVGVSDLEPTLEELFNEIDKLHDYENILKAANECIENIREEYKNQYHVTLVRMLNHTTNENISYSDTEEEGEEDSDESEYEDSDDEEADQWEHTWETDSGLESHTENEENQWLNKELEASFNSDSGAEQDWLLNWSSNSDLERYDDSEDETEESSESD